MSAPSPGPLRRSTAFHLATVTAVVALVSTLLAGVVALGLARQTIDTAARASLGRDADTLAAVVGPAPEGRRADDGGREVGVGGVQRLLERRDIVSVVVPGRGVGDTEALPPPFVASDARDVAAAVGRLSDVRSVDGQRWFVEGRAAADGAGVVLLAQTDERARAIAPEGRRALLVPLLLGLLGGAAAGALLAASFSRPLVAVAAAARRLSAGERGVRVTPAGPVEVADVAVALDELDRALSSAENRQKELLLAVSHELRTPLTTIRGYAEAMADGTVAARDVPGAADVVLQESLRLNSRVEDLLALARLDTDGLSLRRGPCELRALLMATARAWNRRVETAGLRLRTELPERDVVVTTDGDRVRQMLDALLDNAVRLSPAGSPLVLALRLIEVPGQGSVVVEVRDAGPGLTADDRAVAFERGALQERYRGRRPVGSGVGLALVGGLAAHLGGRAEAVPSPEGGTAFRLHLPR